MKAFLRNLAIAALFVMPAFGQKDATPVQNPTTGQAGTIQTVEPAAQVLPVEKAEEPNGSYSMLRAVGGLGLVTFLMIGGYFAVRKLTPRFFSKGTSIRNLKVVETLSMGDKRSITMIEVGNNRFLVGNTAHQISLLMALPDSGPVASKTEPETLPEAAKAPSKKKSMVPFRIVFENEKKRPQQQTTHPLPDDVRVKMRQLREALER
ncbi:MAG TPA: flagellar biosynthetic protein FliO [Acidobacteriota bacterium]|nr:flagellar biosynthetic protein FliO [Acidobacteriota bacterium]